MEAIRKLRIETWEWLAFHKKRKAAGRIEALACQIRLKALNDALKALEEEED